MISKEKLSKIKYLANILIQGKLIYPENFDDWKYYAVDKFHDAMRELKITLPYSSTEVAQALKIGGTGADDLIAYTDSDTDGKDIITEKHSPKE